MSLGVLGTALIANLLPNGKTVKLYGTTMSRLNRRPFVQDWAALFRLERGAQEITSKMGHGGAAFSTTTVVDDRHSWVSAVAR